ncbi:MAG: RES family NAD+ phosphorylase, partial [Chlorobi bacterium]|nr:RES family NAD+ phosphorylase [Chlorobiota bacterium]
SGKGAEKAGGRWNSKGAAVVYTSQSRALCVAEIAVHADLGIVPTGYELVTIEIPDTVGIYEIIPDELPPDWKSIPYPGTLQEIGDTLIRENKYLVIKVPSAVVQGDFNYLLNPAHPDFLKVKVLKTEKFSFDDRMFF